MNKMNVNFLLVILQTNHCLNYKEPCSCYEVDFDEKFIEILKQLAYRLANVLVIDALKNVED